MPRYSVWAIRASLVYVAAGFTLGALLLFNKGIPWFPFIWRLLPAHIETLLLGWVVQLVLGMAFWILPRFGTGARRGNVKAAWAAFVLLNLGIWLAGLGPLFPQPVLVTWIPFIGRLAECAAALAFALHAWPRIKSAKA